MLYTFARCAKEIGFSLHVPLLRERVDHPVSALACSANPVAAVIQNLGQIIELSEVLYLASEASRVTTAKHRAPEDRLVAAGFLAGSQKERGAAGTGVR